MADRSARRTERQQASVSRAMQAEEDHQRRVERRIKLEEEWKEQCKALHAKNSRELSFVNFLTDRIMELEMVVEILVGDTDGNNT